MDIRHALLAAIWVIATTAQAREATGTAVDDTSFQLTATADDFEHYFPGQLGNGFMSTLTGPRGTEGNLAYLAAFMDYGKDDIARPAAIPGWTGFDYSTGPSAAGQFWLNLAPLDARTFGGYRQVLDLKQATLTTHYRYHDHGRDTDVQVVSLVSMASPHLAATRLTITPQFDGEVELVLGLDLWAPHQPRFPLAKLTGDQMQEAVTANNLTLQAIPPATADRAALWYHGDTHVTAADANLAARTLWLDGRAEQGLRMAQAVAVQAPRSAQATLYRSDYALKLRLRLTVHRGQSYAITKYVATSRQDWGGDARADLRLAVEARRHGFDALLAAHRAAWARLWQSDIRIEGDPKAQRLVHSDLYYLLSNTTAGTAWPTGACGMTPGYSGHVFWDSDSWVMPALLLLHPQRARSLAMFRSRTLPAARQRAKARGLEGAMYPWEADPERGTEQTPHFAYVLGEREIHVNADIAIAQWQYYLASGDRAWLRQHGWPVIREIARFWTSRSRYDAKAGRYEILHVTSVDEDYNDVPNDTVTNVSAAKALRIATEAAALVGVPADPRWAKIADGMYVPFDAAAGHHLDFDPSVPHDQDTWGGSALPMLSYPSLDLPMSPELRRRDYDYALEPITHSHRDPNSMGLAPLSIAAATLGNDAEASAWFERNLTADVIKPPFNVRTETAGNNTGYFLTAAGGLLQNIIYGFSGLRIQSQGLVAAYPPMLPPGWTSLTLRHVRFRGQSYDLVVKRDGNGHAVLTRLPATPDPSEPGDAP